MVKTIVFDLWGCLLKENNCSMTEQEEILEKQFWNLNNDKEYFSWATKTLSLSEGQIKAILSPLWEKLYSLKEQWIFEKILKKYPNINFAIATNHISDVKESLKHLWILKRCKTVLISWDCGYEKPSKEFYELLIKEIWLPAKEILFIDDKQENTKLAEDVGLKILHYHQGTSLSETIISYLWKAQ